MPKPIRREIASLGNDPDIFYGWLNYHENPDPILRHESEGKGISFYDEVDRDDRAGAVLEARYEAVAGEDFEVVQGGKTKRDKKIAEFVYENLSAINFPSATKDLMGAILYGYYGLEIIWSQSQGGQVLIDKLIGKHPRRLLFDQDRNPRLRTRANLMDGEPLPDKKFIILSFGDTENPYGKGLGRRLWWPVWFKKNGIKFWAVFLEKFGAPTAVATYPQGATDDQKREIQQAVELVQTRTGIKIPEGFALSLLEASRSGSGSYEEMVQRMDTAITITVRKQNLTTEVQQGSRAASETHDSVEHRTTKMDAKLVEDEYNETLIRWLVDYNFSGVKSYPKLRYITEKEEIQKEEAETYEILSKEIGLNIDPAWLADKMNVKTDGPARIGSSTSGQGSSEFAEEEDTAVKDQRQIDGLVDRAVAEVDLKDNEEAILSLVSEANSYEDIYSGLLELYQEISIDVMQDVLQRALLMAQAAGIASVEAE